MPWGVLPPHSRKARPAALASVSLWNADSPDHAAQCVARNPNSHLRTLESDGGGHWSLLFSWAFGSFLLARNWAALGDRTKARRCMIWFYAIFPWMPLYGLIHYWT